MKSGWIERARLGRVDLNPTNGVETRKTRTDRESVRDRDPGEERLMVIGAKSGFSRTLVSYVSTISFLPPGT